MSRPFVSNFLVPLVRGGVLHVGRPLGRQAIDRVARAVATVEKVPGLGEPVAALAASRQAAASRFLIAAPPPPLDEATLRLGAALHDLLALGHPDLAGRGLEARQERIAAAALALASIGPPATAADAVNRHSLLARMPEIVRSDSTVHFWLGRQAFVGRVPPRRVTALPALRRVRVEVVKRAWLREIGIPSAARPAFLALNVASPLGEALDPLRLDPPLAWSRILPALRFAEIARVVAGQALAVGVDRAGDAFAEALLRFASFQDPQGGVPATAAGVAFALRFLAHLVWLDVLFGAAARADADGGAGADLAVLLMAAERTSPALVWPRGLPADGDLGHAFRARLDAMAERARARGLTRFEAAVGVAEFATAPVTRPVEVGASPS